MKTEEYTNNNQILTTIEAIEQTTKDHIDSNKLIVLEMIQHNKENKTKYNKASSYLKEIKEKEYCNKVINTLEQFYKRNFIIQDTYKSELFKRGIAV